MQLSRKIFNYLLIFSLVFNNLAFATQSIIELDFKDSPPSQRLHVIPRLSNVDDVSHVEINTEKRQVNVYRVDAILNQKKKKTPLSFILKQLRGILSSFKNTISLIFRGN